jgi:hypothetical protein
MVYSFSLEFSDKERRLMDTLPLGTFLVALYTIIDDLYQASHQLCPSHPGAKPAMTDSEILTLALSAQWLHLPERTLIRYVKAHWQTYFPHLISQSQYNRRFRSLAQLMTRLVAQASEKIKDYFKSNYEILDTIGVPLMKKCRGLNHKLFPVEIADIGLGGSDREWYYGVKLVIAVNPEGLASGFMLAPASTSDRWLAEYLLCYRHNPAGHPASAEDLPPSHKAGARHKGPGGPIWPKQAVGSPNAVPYLADLGFNGKWWEEHWQTAYGAKVLVSDRYQGEPAGQLKRQHYARRQTIETVNEHLSDELNLKRVGARCIQGLLARIAAKLLALNLGIWLNKLFGRPNFALATLFSW